MIKCFFENGKEAIGGGLRHAVVDMIGLDKEMKKIVLVKRSSSALDEPNKWAMPGGYIDRNERAASAAEREFREETGYELDGAAIFLGYEDNPRRGGQKSLDEDRQNITWLFGGVAGEQVNEPDNESSAVKWWPLDDLPAMEDWGFDHYELIMRFVPKLKQNLKAKEKGIVIGGQYKHFKGGEYIVLGIVKDSETLEDLVLYEAQYDNPQGKTWTRPIAMWNEWVKKPEYNYSGPRFKLMTENK